MVRSPFRLAAGLIALAACSDGYSPAAPSRLAPLLQPNGSVSTQVVPNEYIVVLQDNVKNVAAAADDAESAGNHVIARWESAVRGYAVQAAPGQLNGLRADGRVKFVELNGVVTKSATQAPTPSWGLDRIDQTNLPLNSSFTYPGTASNVHAYTIDTGILLTHSQFAGRMGPGFDAVTSGGNANDCDGHGTHVSGTIGGSTYGVAKGVTFHPVRVLDCTGSGSYAGVISGINWVAANRILPAVANMSLGGGFSASVNAATNGLVSAGVFTAVAAGNSNVDACNTSPASASSATTVNSSTSTDARSSFSNFGPCTDIFAPGSSIVSAYIGSNTATASLSGTSMASPHVAGAAALYLSANPSATPAQVDAALKNNASLNKITNPGTGSPNRLLNISFLNGTSPVNQAPVANFSITCTVLVQCTMDANLSTDDAGLGNLTFTWVASGGRAGRTGTPVQYSYEKDQSLPNVFQLTLTATDAGGLQSSITKTVSIAPAPANQPPVANFTIACVTGTQCTTNASSSTDDGGFNNLTFSWTATGGRSSQSGSTVSWPYSGSGSPANTFNVTLTVTDAGGLTSTMTQTVTIPPPPSNQPPVADFTITCNPRVECKMDASISSDDGGLGNLTFTWVASGGRAGRSGNPVWYSFEKDLSLPNVFDLTLTATDAAGLKSTKTKTVSIQ